MAREFAKAFYKSAAWKKTREYIFNKYHGLCVNCGNPGEEVHHKRHNKRKKSTREGLVFNEQGELVRCDE